MGNYRVQSGDTLSALASRFHTSVSQLAATNHIRNVNLIYTGSVLQVPGAAAKPPHPARHAPSAHARAPQGHSPQDTFAPSNATAIGKLPRTGNAFIDTYARAAIESQKKTGVPASVTMAQAILESGWGKSGLTRDANNFFGMKGSGPAGSVTVRTREVVNGHSIYINAAFRKYHNAQESFADHGNLLKNASRYRPAFAYKNNPEQFAREIQKSGYATDPHYASTLISIMRQYHLARFDKVG